MPLPATALHVGDRCPDFLVPADGGMSESFHALHAGRPVALLLAHDAAALTRFAALPAGSAVFGVVAGAADPAGASTSAAWPVLHAQAGLLRHLGLPDADPGGAAAPLAWVLDASLRLRLRLPDAQPAQVLDALATLDAEQAAAPAPRLVRSAVAPVLMLPAVFDTGLCRRLVEAHAADHASSGMLRLIDGQAVLQPDARSKQRLDHRLTDPALADAVTQALSRRVLPEIATAFQYGVTRLEGYKIAAYDGGSGGWFRLHRDNITPDARHRRFALTVALDDDFDGGALRFPEYSADLYRPPAGGAIVFSGSLLHEVTDVTRGRRHVLLSFLWGDESAG